MTDAGSPKVIKFQTLNENLGRFRLSNTDKTFLIPEMSRIGSHLIAASFRGMGIRSHVLETYRGLDLGKEYTSGKECFPCQITTGDVLYFFKNEKERLQDRFDPENYIYFMPEAEGPCRFGMYNKYQRIVLDSFPDLKRVKIGSLTTSDGYSLDGIIEPESVGSLRKSCFISVVVTDILERLLWRIRPYEKKKGSADGFIEEAMHRMEDAFHAYGAENRFDKILERVEQIIEEGMKIIDPDIPRKPLIGIVGEIYLRTHSSANQDLIRQLENFGGEVVNASLSEWVNYTSYERLREAKIGMRFGLKQFRIESIRENLRKILRFGTDLFYQQMRQNQFYTQARKRIDIEPDHRIGKLERMIKESDCYSFDAGTEACLSIAGILQYVKEGFNGVVNVYPFTCMPSTVTSAIVKPMMSDLQIPYLDTPYDGSFQPGREAAIRTFMYQAGRHYQRHGRKKN